MLKHTFFYICICVKYFNCSDAALIENTSTVMVGLKVTINGKEKVFHGFGMNKKQAKCAAAKQALKRLQKEK